MSNNLPVIPAEVQEVLDRGREEAPENVKYPFENINILKREKFEDGVPKLSMTPARVRWGIELVQRQVASAVAVEIDRANSKLSSLKRLTGASSRKGRSVDREIDMVRHQIERLSKRIDSTKYNTPANYERWIFSARKYRDRFRNGESVLGCDASSRVTSVEKSDERVKLAIEFLVKETHYIVEERSDEGTGTLILEDIIMMLDAIFNFGEEELMLLKSETGILFADLYILLMRIEEANQMIEDGDEDEGEDTIIKPDIDAMKKGLRPLLYKINMIARGGSIEIKKTDQLRAEDYLTSGRDPAMDIHWVE